MAIRPKTQVTMKKSAHGQSHTRTMSRSRDVYSIVDEPAERGGTNLGLTPTETLMSALMACTNVITNKIAHARGVAMGEMRIALETDFDRRGVGLIEEVDVPFTEVRMSVEVETGATEAQLAEIRADLQKFCPLAKVIRAAGTPITETWTALPMPAAKEHA
ncbi:OsmC family protein [Histidinibacterium lentulum]|uniref:OsmC family peroxiredoxin n=1 Tax=Histidinibacterium lentulum TaxID=2480588 RepID=A0A3N2R9T3_9RHOB|nr:OsmC family protein [Histidinibacterium lentulum]ROU04230.1 OsmC family peroxiredoxin [Histidinibacterium lentulum]